MDSKKISLSFSRTIWQTVAVIIITGIALFTYITSEKIADHTNELRSKSLVLANEFRASSDDLTQMIRAYIITGNLIYKQHYQEILDIRNGLKPRPLDYDNIYWCLVGLNNKRPTPSSGKSIPLIKMMQKVGMVKNEFVKLVEAKKKSNKLRQIEKRAIKLVEIKKLNKKEKEINREKAINLLYNKAFYQAKISAMRPIEEFNAMIKKRMNANVHRNETIVSYSIIFFILIGFLLLFMLWHLYKILEKILGGTVDDIHNHITHIGKGDFSPIITVTRKNEDSILGWLGKTRDTLKQLIKNNERLSRFYAALSQCNQAIVRSKNESELFPIICRDAIDFAGMKMAWVGMVDERSQTIKPIANYGNGSDYIHEILISINPNNEASKGPSGQAYLTNKPFWCQDYIHDAITTQWHNRGKKYGWGSSAALPLQKNGKVVGVFNLYAEKVNTFDDKVQNLLEEMAMDISYALDGFEHETVREKAKNELINSHTLLSSVINTVPVRVFWKDKDLNYLGCNLIFAKDAGEDNPNNIIGKSDLQLYWKENAEIFRAIDRKVIDSGISKLFYEEQEITPEGKSIWVSKSKIPLRNKNNEIIGVLGIYEDLTQRKEMELALKMEKETAQNYLDIVGVIILVLDTNNNVMLINRKGCEILGYKANEIIGKNWIDNFLPERFKQKVIEVSHSIMKPQKSKITYFENPVLTKSGEEQMIAWNNTPLLDNNGNIIGALVSGEDITERRVAEERNIYLANNDLLTGLPNRAYLNDHLRYALSMAKRNKENLAVMFLDLDHFKDINDTLGHNIGDLLLIETAKRLKSALREVDTIARLGGDEFIILLPNIKVDGVGKVAQKLLDMMKKSFLINQHELNLTVSIGIAVYPNDGTDFNNLYKNADIAMYRAKQEGRNGYCFFTDEMQQYSIRNLELSNAMSHALDKNQFEIYYQPQITSKNGEVIGAEALLRWHHSELGMISPAEFIPIAENNGLILAIGEWVLRTAIKQARQWMDEGMKPIVIAVNISAVQFRHLNLPDTITHILDEVGLPPEYLELELTESVAMYNPQQAISTMNDLHNRGVRMSIDDFGTGYSSLSYLKKFKIYKLKIDQSFVRDINIDNEDKAIVSTIINMAKSLGLKIIAEGVETIGQLEYLEEQGCDEIQGYYYSKPLPVKEFETFRNNQQKDSK